MSHRYTLYQLPPYLQIGLVAAGVVLNLLWVRCMLCYVMLCYAMVMLCCVAAGVVLSLLWVHCPDGMPSIVIVYYRKYTIE